MSMLSSNVRVFAAKPGPLGLSVQEHAGCGLLVTGIQPSCPFRGGVRVGDRLATLDGRRIDSAEELERANDAGREREVGIVSRPRSVDAAAYTKGQLLALKESDAAYFATLDFAGVAGRHGEEFYRRLGSPKQHARHLREGGGAADADDGREYKPPVPAPVPGTKGGLRTRSGAVLREPEQTAKRVPATALKPLWGENLAALLEHHKENGHFHPPADTPLGRWADAQRASRKKGKLTPERAELLEKAGFVWHTRAAAESLERWEEQYASLVRYKEVHGNYDVPTRNQKLRSWVTNQRYLHRNGRLSAEHAARLGDIGFDLEEKKASPWDAKFQALVAFKEANGHCKVPQHSGPLGMWVKLQRKLYKKGELSAERIARLEDIDFTWTCIKRKGPRQITYAMLQAAMFNRSG